MNVNGLFFWRKIMKMRKEVFLYKNKLDRQREHLDEIGKKYFEIDGYLKRIILHQDKIDFIHEKTITNTNKVAAIQEKLNNIETEINQLIEEFKQIHEQSESDSNIIQKIFILIPYFLICIFFYFIYVYVR